MVLFWPYGAGCIWNDILDRNYDRQVERTKNRPIAAGTISVFGAIVFLFVHIAIMVNMIWNFDRVAIYPLMKRFTYWPQAWLGMSEPEKFDHAHINWLSVAGLAMNCGVPMAWLALGQGVPPSIIILYAGTWAWTMWYGKCCGQTKKRKSLSDSRQPDTIYACQDKRDDVKAGVKSIALLFGTWIRPILFGFAFTLVSSLFLAGVINNMGVYYYMISVLGGSVYLAHDTYTVDLDSPKACWDSFHRNGFTFGGLVWAGTLTDYILSL
ncbi:hypothetical protein C0995_006005 [Termitomyces sp. Mi166|nr:hypothetical protein C0995_006005 [Termitomyces sp. Mi166\